MTHRALITGVSGFVGGYLAEHLLACGDAVLGISPDGTWLEASPPSVRRQVEILAWDFGQPEGPEKHVRQALERFRPEAIYHLAAISVPGDCGQNEPTSLAHRVNVDGTRRVLDLAASLAGNPRVLAISSNHVYATVSPECPQVNEDAPLSPRRGYGRTKLLAEEAVRRAVGERNAHAVIARAFQHTGPGQSPRMMLPEWAVQFARGGSEPVEVHTLDAYLDLTDVRDVVRAYRLLAERGTRGEVYNVGSGIARRSGDILEMLRKLAAPGRRVVERYPGVKQEPIADVTRLVRQTGWQPRISLEETVRETYDWWKERVLTKGL